MLNFFFVGAKDKMEMQKIQAGFQIKGLWIAGLQKNSLQNLMFPLSGR
jgi:hypothetical protein